MGNRALGKRSFTKGEQRWRETCWRVFAAFDGLPTS